MVARTKPHIERAAEIVSEFYAHLLRYPPTRKFFQRKDGTLDKDYVELRMRHLTNFWLRTASGDFDDDYARYVDYVGRAHTSHGADPQIYIAERYVIGQVGFMSARHQPRRWRSCAPRATRIRARGAEAWDKLMMVILEMLSRAYGHEREPETFEPTSGGRQQAVAGAGGAFAVEHELGDMRTHGHRSGRRAGGARSRTGERKIVEVDGLSIGVFHHAGGWYALRNACLHRGGPSAPARWRATR